MRTDIVSSSLRELDAVALATNVKVFLGRDTSLLHVSSFVDTSPIHPEPVNCLRRLTLPLQPENDLSAQVDVN